MFECSLVVPLPLLAYKNIKIRRAHKYLRLAFKKMTGAPLCY